MTLSDDFTSHALYGWAEEEKGIGASQQWFAARRRYHYDVNIVISLRAVTNTDDHIDPIHLGILRQIRQITNINTGGMDVL